ncbi:MAG: hypothetical protein ACE5FQ_02160 [Thiogranum sp.]
MKFIQAVAVALVLGWLAGCSSTGDSKESDVAVEDRSDAAADGAATTSSVGAYGDLSIESLNDPNSPLAQRVIYFEFDSSDVAEQDRKSWPHTRLSCRPTLTSR